MSPTGAEIGTVLGGRYRLTGLLGRKVAVADIIVGISRAIDQGPD
jgi:hypothetical protein